MILFNNTPKEKVKIAVNENNEIVAFDEWVSLYQEDLESVGMYNIYHISLKFFSSILDKSIDNISYLDIYEMDKNKVVVLLKKDVDVIMDTNANDILKKLN